MKTLDFEPITIVVPIRQEPPGVLRVGKSRVLLELVLRAFQAGATPESIVQSYDTLNLADVYAVVTGYLACPGPFEEYLRIREEVAEKARRAIEEFQGSQGNLRAILLARAKAKLDDRSDAASRRRTPRRTVTESLDKARDVLAVEALRGPRPGGVWRFVMHGPDGKDYPNESVFIEIVKPERIVFDHVPRPRFRMTILFEELGDKTRFTFHMVFKSRADRDAVKGLAVEGNEQNFDRLQAKLATMR